MADQTSDAPVAANTGAPSAGTVPTSSAAA